MITVIDLFSGIGAIRKALTNANIEHKTLFFSEIDKKAIDAYRIIHNDRITPNLGDISKIKAKQLTQYKNKCDLLVFGSPCVDFSHAGNNLGGKKGSKTRSSLLWNAAKIIKTIKPKIVIFENVKNIMYQKHKGVLNEYINFLTSIGYANNEPLLLNALQFNIPQNRERVFVISVLNKYSHKRFFNNINKLSLNKLNYLPLKEFLNIDNFNNRRLLKEKIQFRKWTNFSTWRAKSGNINGSYNRAWKINSYCGTLSVCNVIKITDNDAVSRLTSLEAFKLMGFTEQDYEKVKTLRLSETQMHSLAGNSIVVSILKNFVDIINKTYFINNELLTAAKNIQKNQTRVKQRRQPEISARV